MTSALKIAALGGVIQINFDESVKIVERQAKPPTKALAPAAKSEPLIVNEVPPVPIPTIGEIEVIAALREGGVGETPAVDDDDEDAGAPPVSASLPQF